MAINSRSLRLSYSFNPMKLAVFALLLLHTLTTRIEDPLDSVGIFTALNKLGVLTFNDIIPLTLYKYSTAVKIWTGDN